MQTGNQPALYVSTGEMAIERKIIYLFIIDLLFIINTYKLTVIMFFVGIHSRPVRTFSKPWFGSTHVRLTMVPHALHSQISSLHGFSYHRPTAV